MEMVNKEVIKTLKSLYEKFPENIELDIRKSDLTEKQITGLLRFLSEEGFIRVNGSSPIFNLSLTGKGYQFIHSFLKKANQHKETLIIYQGDK